MTDSINSLVKGSNENYHSDEIMMARQATQSVAANDLPSVLNTLNRLTTVANELPKQHIIDTINAIQTSDWSQIGDNFIHKKFIGSNGHFLFVAPSRQIRLGQETTKLTAICGQQISYKFPPIAIINKTIEDEFDQTCKNPQIIPYKPLAVAGNAGEKAEAFSVGNGFVLPDSHRGPSLNNMSLQHSRFKTSIRCIQQIFEPNSADCLLSPLMDEDQDSQHRSVEYSFHDFGHEIGLGLEFKDLHQLLNNPLAAGVEESRSDGISMHLVTKVLSPVEASKIITTNICVRLGLDAHRNGGMNRDADVVASLLNFCHWWDSDELDIYHGKLRLKNLTPKGLLRLVRPLSEWAIRLTHQELDLDYPSGLSRLYGGTKVNPAVESIFKGLVLQPCQGFFQNLN